MERKLLLIISLLALLCFCGILNEIYYTLKIFHMLTLSETIQTHFFLLLFFLFLCLSSFLHRFNLMFIILSLGMFWSYITNPLVWLGAWMYGALPEELYKPSDFRIFTSGLAALCFLIILILSAIILIRRIYLYWQVSRR